MSFPLVYCSSCKSSLRIASCQIPSPKTHTGASNAPRTHFHRAGSKRGTKCQRARRSQNPLQHTWLALQLSAISVFTGAGKKRFLSFESTTVVPEQALSCYCSLGVTWKGFGDSSVGQPSLSQPPENSFCSWEKFSWRKRCRCEAAVDWICATGQGVHSSQTIRGVWLIPLIPAHPRPTNPPHSQGNSGHRKWTLPSHLPTASLTFLP